MMFFPMFSKKSSNKTPAIQWIPWICRQQLGQLGQLGPSRLRRQVWKTRAQQLNARIETMTVVWFHQIRGE